MSGRKIISAGLIIGVAAAQKGSMDSNVTRMLSIHIGSLLPPSSTDLEVSPIVQTAALMGVGLLYEGNFCRLQRKRSYNLSLGTAHRRMTEILLGEIGRKPSSDIHLNREGYNAVQR